MECYCSFMNALIDLVNVELRMPVFVTDLWASWDFTITYSPVFSSETQLQTPSYFCRHMPNGYKTIFKTKVLKDLYVQYHRHCSNNSEWRITIISQKLLEVDFRIVFHVKGITIFFRKANSHSVYVLFSPQLMMCTIRSEKATLSNPNAAVWEKG